MLKQYALLTMCENELKKTKMPPILRLKIDMQIMQAKCTLLDSGVKAKIQGNARSEKFFTDLYDQVACSSTGQGERALDEILVNLHRINQGVVMSLLQVPPNSLGGCMPLRPGMQLFRPAGGRDRYGTEEILKRVAWFGSIRLPYDQVKQQGVGQH